MRATVTSALCLALLGSCGGDSNTDTQENLVPGPPQGACSIGDRVGFFELRLADGFSAFTGQVRSAKNPLESRVVEEEELGCQLVSPPSVFCDPQCEGGEVCVQDNQCRPEGVGVSLGEVRLQGLASELAIPAPAAPIFRYDFLGEIPHPATSAGQELVLQVEGSGDASAFALAASGIDAISGTEQSLALQSGEALVVTWDPGGEGSQILIDLNIAQHGGTAGAVWCEVEDNGSFAIPISLSDALLSRGASGFPSVELTRRSADHEETEYGCVEFRSVTEVSIEIEIDGLTSCSGPKDCRDGETCQPDLTCG